MISNIHKQDQIHNRVDDLMIEENNNQNQFDWDEVFQNAATFSLIIVFMTLGLNY